MPAEGGRLRWWAVLLWLFLWQMGSMALGSSLLLVSPVRVILRLWELCPTPAFWRAVLFTLLRITGGFFAALFTGTLLAVLAHRWRRMEELLLPAMAAVKTVPVASFIILALLCVSSKNLSLLISFLMVLPVVYTNALTGLCAVDRQLLEMAQVFRLPLLRRLRYLYLPALWPYLTSACTVGAGLSWKAGVAAEVIGLPDGSIGERLYQAKVYFDTPDLFAYTLTVVLLSAAFEKLLRLLLRRWETALGRL